MPKDLKRITNESVPVVEEKLKDVRLANEETEVDQNGKSQAAISITWYQIAIIAGGIFLFAGGLGGGYHLSNYLKSPKGSAHSLTVVRQQAPLSTDSGPQVSNDEKNSSKPKPKPKPKKRNDLTLD